MDQNDCGSEIFRKKKHTDRRTIKNIEFDGEIKFNRPDDGISRYQRTCSQIFNSCPDVTTEIKNKVEQLCNPITHCTLLIPDPEQKKKEMDFFICSTPKF